MRSGISTAVTCEYPIVARQLPAMSLETPDGSLTLTLPPSRCASMVAELPAVLAVTPSPGRSSRLFTAVPSGCSDGSNVFRSQSNVVTDSDR